ncbi:hypothetical protein LguiB_009707 [Lonicera macranthoides]
MVVEDEGEESKKIKPNNNNNNNILLSKKRRSSEPPINWLTNFQRDLMAGAVMGGVVHTIVAPIERAKLLLQTQESNMAILSSPHRRFKGMVDCIVRTVKEEGILSLWRGNGSSVLRYYPSVALNFSLKVIDKRDYCVVDWLDLKNDDMIFHLMLYFLLRMKVKNVLLMAACCVEVVKRLSISVRDDKDLYRNILRSGHFQEGHFMPAASANFIAGAAAGCTTLIIIYPLDIAHTRLAADIGRTESRQFRGISHFLSTVRKKHGIRGIYKGLPASLHGMIIHRGLYFGGFDTIKERMASSSDGSNAEVALWKRWVVAQAVTTSAGLLSYPLDTVRRRMMMQSGLEHPMYMNTLDCWRKIYRTGGVASFYHGALSNMFRSTGAAAILVLYDEVKKFLWGGL